ncbi:class II aldolase/adducin family protein [Nocardia sp. NPDC051321]|uniref:class II aldolase/adducin family protein n=1 Tax=Nocardia sp. NPDC051321 TaxID=3364323 RepID=UPI0037A2710E
MDVRRRTVEQERAHRKQRLAATMRLFARLGFDEGVGGHVTARDPEYPDRFWVNPFGGYFGHVRASELLLVDAAGAVVSGDGTVNPAGYAIHSQIHAARPDVVAAAHTHSTYGRAWSALRRPLAPLTQDACAFFEDHAVFDEYSGVVLDLDEGRRIAAALAGHKAVILSNHGLLTVGGSVEEAAWWFISMDRCCHVQLLAAAAGTPEPIPAESARRARELIGTPGIARLNFKPLFRSILAEMPDLVD